MYEYAKINSLSPQLAPVFLSQQSFWKRFQRQYRVEDPFVRIYDICLDKANQRNKVAVKDYSSSTQKQCQDVLLNLTGYRTIEKIEELCELVAFCQEEATGDIRAAFQYREYSLEELIEKRYFQENSYQFYLLLLHQLFTSIQSFKRIGIPLEELIPSSILLYKKGETFKLKILYDERQKKYDKIQQGIKVYCSPQKVNKAIRQYQEYESIDSQEIIFELGLLLLDIVYLYESSAPKLADQFTASSNSKNLISTSALFKGYLIFEDYQNCHLNQQLINLKIQFIKSLKSVFLNELSTLISKMVSNISSRITIQALGIEINKLSLFRKAQNKMKIEFPFFGASQKEISPIKSKQSSYRPEDSLRYSQSYQSDRHLKKALISQTTMPTLNGISSSLKGEIDIDTNDKRLDFFVIPKEKLLSINCHIDVNKKLQLFLIELQNKVNLIKKDYYDNNTYYGQINPVTQKRAGLGIYIYRNGDIYFGTWRDNSLVDGTYIFKNGECFEGYVRDGKQGKGKYYYSNGNIYEGEWKNDLKHGIGKMFYSNGDSYDGSWQKGKKNGLGAYFYSNGTIYHGQFLNGKKHGLGTIDFTDGTKVEANWVANHIQGRGKVFYKNGDYFEGSFNYSIKDGTGQYRWPDSTRYEGFFRKDLMEGEAKIKFGDSQYYQGHIVEGKREGQGLYRYANGDEFQGIWKNDEKYSGIYTYSSGGSFEGKFKQGEMAYGVMLYPNGESYEGQFAHGERHGSGVYRSSAGAIKYEGQWNRDKFVS